MTPDSSWLALGKCCNNNQPQSRQAVAIPKLTETQPPQPCGNLKWPNLTEAAVLDNITAPTSTRRIGVAMVRVNVKAMARAMVTIGRTRTIMVRVRGGGIAMRLAPALVLTLGPLGLGCIICTCWLQPQCQCSKNCGANCALSLQEPNWNIKCKGLYNLVSYCSMIRSLGHIPMMKGKQFLPLFIWCNFKWFAKSHVPINAVLEGDVPDVLPLVHVAASNFQCLRPAQELP